MVRECRGDGWRRAERVQDKLHLTDPKFTEVCMQIVSEVQKHIIKKDQALQLDKVSNHQLNSQIAEGVGWKRFKSV